MEELAAGLQLVQVLVFLGAAIAAFRLWIRNRGRPAARLAMAFGTIGVALLLGRLFPADGAGADLPLVRDLVVVGLAMFPWLLALFAWSFEPKMPRWLVPAGGAVLLLAAWVLWLPPEAIGGTARSPAGSLFVGAFIVVWVVLAAAAGVRLWRAGGTQPVVRARMRLLSLGVVVLTAALLLAGAVPTASGSILQVGTVSLSIVSALLFVAGFAPPRMLRVWWRGRSTGAWQQMQLDLLSAASPEQAARAVVPVVSGLLGGGAAIVTDDGQVLAAAGMTDEEAQQAAARIGAGADPGSDDEVVELESAAMIVRPTPYTPLFGQDERDLVTGFAGQLRLALDRVQLHERGERAGRELRRAREEEQAMIMGLAHDLRGSSNTLGGFTMLLRTSRDDAEREEILSGIEASSSHLEALVDSLLELSRVGSARARTDVVDLGEVVDEVVARLEPAHPQLSVHRTPLPLVVGDRLELVQVFDNLVLNAARHGGPDVSTITITSEQGADTVSIDIHDDGRGVDLGDRASIFRLFQRGRSANGGGSGVGLNLVRRIIEAHDGTIELLDDVPGAHFRLCLPSTSGVEPER